MFRRSKDDDSTVKDAAKDAAKVALAGKVVKEAVTNDEQEQDTSGGKGKLLVLLLAGAAALGYVLKKRQDRERDETLWREPRPL